MDPPHSILGQRPNSYNNTMHSRHGSAPARFPFPTVGQAMEEDFGDGASRNFQVSPAQDGLSPSWTPNRGRGHSVGSMQEFPYTSPSRGSSSSRRGSSVSRSRRNSTSSVPAPTFGCRGCEKTFKTFKQLSRHENNIHIRPQKCPFEGCMYLERGFPNIHDLVRHLKTKAHGLIPDSSTVWVCPLCLKMDIREDNHNIHMEHVHADVDHQSGFISSRMTYAQYQSTFSQDSPQVVASGGSATSYDDEPDRSQPDNSETSANNNDRFAFPEECGAGSPYGYGSAVGPATDRDMIEELDNIANMPPAGSSNIPPSSMEMQAHVEIGPNSSSWQRHQALVAEVCATLAGASLDEQNAILWGMLSDFSVFEAVFGLSNGVDVAAPTNEPMLDAGNYTHNMQVPAAFGDSSDVSHPQTSYLEPDIVAQPISDDDHDQMSSTIVSHVSTE